MAKKSKTDAPGTEDKMVQVVRVVRRSDGFASFYANETQVQTGPWDVRLLFAVIEIDENEAGKTATINQVAEVRMSPQHALTVYEILGAQLRSYEQKFGKIPQLSKPG
jgi:hypothetical protein